MSFTSFVSDLKEQCRKHNIALKLTDGVSVKIDNGIFSSGYFDGESIACAMRNKNARTVLIHESCHLDQYIEKSTLWTESMKSDRVDDWLLGKDYDGIDKDIDLLKWLELDCEKRSVKKLKKYNIAFNERKYIQKANAYVLFYNYLKLSRRWPHKSNTPYKNKNVWGNMPESFQPKRWYDKLSNEELILFIRNKI